MAKRFTDNQKWNRNWFMYLSKDEKLLWLYVLDNCEPNGIFDPNWKLINFMLEPDFDDIPKALEKQLVRTNHSRKIFVEDFVRFQYGDLRETSNLHKRIHIVLKDFGIDIPLCKGSGTPKAETKSKSKSNSNVKSKSKVVKKDVSLESINDKVIKELQLRNLSVDVNEEFERFKNNLQAKGLVYKDYQAAFRNWIKSPYTPKTDRIRIKMHEEKREKKRQEEYKVNEEDLPTLEEKREALGLINKVKDELKWKTS